MADNGALVPPDPRHASSAGQSALSFALDRQRDRALGMTIAAVTAFLAKLAGMADFDLLQAAVLLALGYLSVLLLVYGYKRAWRRGQPCGLVPWWLVVDVLLATGVVYLTGGISSLWIVWYIACVGRAALISGLGLAGVVAGGSTVAYLALLMAMGQVHTFDRALVAVVQMLVVLGASAILLMGTAKLRESRQIIRRLHEEEKRKVEELSRVTQDLESVRRMLQDLTLTDSLTGLRNRRYFREMATAESERFARWGTSDRRSRGLAAAGGLLLVDLDRFVSVNETHGRPTGDQVLKHVARTLRQCLRDDDTLIRWGGDEFLILVPLADAERVAARVAQAIRTHPFYLEDGAPLALTCSVGRSGFDGQRRESGDAWEQAVQAAEAALAGVPPDSIVVAPAQPASAGAAVSTAA